MAIAFENHFTSVSTFSDQTLRRIQNPVKRLRWNFLQI